LPQVGGVWDAEVIVDEERDLYAAWGLGTSGVWHAYGPKALSATANLWRAEGIGSRATGSGSRWQTGGAFAIDKEGVVRWAEVARSAEVVPDLEAALRAVLGEEAVKKGQGHQRVKSGVA
jgi:hypothetical protein